MKVTVEVNGTTTSHDVEPRLLLVHYLRENCGLTGTNVGCDTSSCGACTIHLNGEAVKSCTLLAVQADGTEVTDAIRTELQRSMTVGAGVLRTATSLAETAAIVDGLAGQLDDGDDGRVPWEARNLVDVSRAVLAAATERHESRGAHTRVDFTELDPAYRLRLVLAGPG